MNTKHIILNNQNLTISKKNLKKALLADGIDVSLSKSANLLAQTFGFKHEHELQQNLKDIASSKDELILFYFDEMLALLELGNTLIKKYRNSGIDIFSTGTSFFSDYTIYKVYELSLIFKNNKNIIIEQGLDIQILRIVRRLFNEISFKKIDKTNPDFYLFYAFYNYHNIESYFLMNNAERKNYYLPPNQFERDVSGYSDHFNYLADFSADYKIDREVEYYDKEYGILIKRDIYSTFSKKIIVGNSFSEFSYTKIHKK